jgi:hypothetical protein
VYGARSGRLSDSVAVSECFRRQASLKLGPNPNDTLTAQATINVTAASPPPAGGSSSAGGGGAGRAFDALALGILALEKSSEAIGVDGG